MGTPRLHALLGLAVGLVLAGCADDAKPDAGATTQDAAFGSVSGTVLDDAQVALGGASVALVGAQWNVTATTPASGDFLFPNVPPGAYELVATMPAYEAAQQHIQVGAGESVDELELVLVAIPPPLEAYYDALPLHRGFIACAIKVGAATFTTVPLCELDPNHDPFFDFEVVRSQGLVAVVIELAWTPSFPGTAAALREELWKNPNCTDAGCSPEVRYGMMSGASPLKLQFGNATEPFNDSINVEGPTTVTQFAHVSRDEEPVAVLVVQQAVDMYASIFYNMEPDAAYTALPPG